MTTSILHLAIDARTISHSKQRYETLGDWFETNGVRRIRVSDMDNEDYEFLVLLHEMVEQHLCKKRGITAAAVDAFDMQFEKDRPDTNDDEPGDDQAAPYYREHQFATVIERAMCHELGIDWNLYQAAEPK